jgi:hypothetical protein
MYFSLRLSQKYAPVVILSEAKDLYETAFVIFKDFYLAGRRATLHSE